MKTLFLPASSSRNEQSHLQSDRDGKTTCSSFVGTVLVRRYKLLVRSAVGTKPANIETCGWCVASSEKPLGKFFNKMALAALGVANHRLVLLKGDVDRVTGFAECWLVPARVS